MRTVLEVMQYNLTIQVLKLFYLTHLDVNECLTGEARCEQKCINIPGSYQCICDRGYTVAADGRTCVDIDECQLWAGADIDECALGECQGHERICVNTLGQFKCHEIKCPENYVHDSNYKNRCNRLRSVCGGLTEAACKARYPVHITWQYIAIPKGIAITSHRPTITLFTIKGPAHNDSIVQFELNLKRAIPEAPSVLLAIRQNFLLQKGKDRNSAVIAVRDTLDGPQTIELELILRLTKKSQFTGKYIANLIVHVAPHKRHSGGTVQDGYSCLKACKQEDVVCLGNHTKEILYQFRALPSTKLVEKPIEVSADQKTFHMENAILCLVLPGRRGATTFQH
ncbi:calcium binding EGF domain protein [Ostertagia ostertagi]